MVCECSYLVLLNAYFFCLKNELIHLCSSEGKKNTNIRKSNVVQHTLFNHVALRNCGCQSLLYLLSPQLLLLRRLKPMPYTESFLAEAVIMGLEMSHSQTHILGTKSLLLGSSVDINSSPSAGSGIFGTNNKPGHPCGPRVTVLSVLTLLCMLAQVPEVNYYPGFPS